MTAKPKKISIGMKINREKKIFIWQNTETDLSVVKYSLYGTQRNFLAFESIPINPDISEKELSEKLRQILKDLSFQNSHLIACLPNRYAATRYVTIPTQNTAEIEEMTALLSSKYLPSSFKDLVTGFSIVSADKEGYSDILLIIVPKTVIERYIRILNALSVKDYSITLSSYGLANLVSLIEPVETLPVMLFDICLPNIELAIVCGNKFVFSRSFAIAKTEKSWQRLLAEEIKKTKETYLKETSGKFPQKIVVVGAQKDYPVFETLNKDSFFQSYSLAYWQKIKGTDNFLADLQKSDISAASIIGLGLKEIPESLNLLTQEKKAQNKKRSKQKELILLGILGILIIFMWGIILSRGFKNKEAYLERLDRQIQRLSQKAQAYEILEKRSDYLSNASALNSSKLEYLKELYQVTPDNVSLNSLIFEEKQIVLRGQASDISSVFLFSAQLEKSQAFNHYRIKVKYVSSKKTQSQDITDFEITCSEK
jgi:Tfp pilus assembly PilM family ATPase/Tfp pilus assembly protein PilN